MNYKIGFVSLGCPKNLTDTETMIGLLEHEYEIVANETDADIIVVNTCGFIESAKEESINTILEMAAYKKSGLKLLVVTGCLAQRYTEDIKEQLPEVDAIVGAGSYHEIVKIIDEALAGQKPTLCGDINAPIPEGLPRHISTPGYTAYLKIADGCDNCCTYCAIPMIRGRFRSRRIEDIIAEAGGLVKNGVRELILIAQDTTRYGMDIYNQPSLVRLIKELCKIEGLHWLRLHYCYPEMITDELIEVMASENKVCKYIDIPFQHASDNILKLMGRRGSKAEYEKLIVKLRKAMPDIAIRSTFITGFPGETQADFDKLFDFIKKARIDRLGVFAYSEEEGTPAALLPDKVLDELKIKRQKIIMEEQAKISLEKNKAKNGGIIEVLCEGYDNKINHFYGRSGGDSLDIDGKVFFIGEDCVNGSFVNVLITGATQYDLYGEMIV